MIFYKFAFFFCQRRFLEYYSCAISAELHFLLNGNRTITYARSAEGQS